MFPFKYYNSLFFPLSSSISGMLIYCPASCRTKMAWNKQRFLTNLCKQAVWAGKQKPMDRSVSTVIGKSQVEGWEKTAIKLRGGLEIQRQGFEGGELEEYSYQRKQQFVFVSKIQIGSLKSQTGATNNQALQSLLCAISKLHMKSPTNKVFRITEATGFFSVNRKQEVAFIYTAHRSKQKKRLLEQI